MWLFFSSVPLLALSEYYSQLFACVFIMLAFVPWLFQMDTEITNEARGQNEAGGQKWKSWGETPKGKTTTRADEYRETLRRRRRRR